MNTGRTVFAQLVEFLPRRAFECAVKRHGADRRPLPAFSCIDQLLCMIFAQLTGRSSLRETVSCLRAVGPQRYHCGIRTLPARSTFAEANETRDWRIFRDTALSMIAAARLELPTDPELLRLEQPAFALDSTTVDLCLKLFPWALFRRRKAAVKAHVLLDLHSGIPVFMRVTHAKSVDVETLDHILPQPGAFYVMDKGYTDFARLWRLHAAGAFFITRAKRNMDFRAIGRRPVTAGGPVKSDRLIRLRGVNSRHRYPDTLRRIRCIDPRDGRRLVFLTNQLTLAAEVVAMLYRKRWKVELFFKWIKQHLHVKAFFGNSPNAVKAQLWIAVIVFVLIHRVKHRYGLSRTTNEIFQVLGLTILQKTPINEVFSQFEHRNAEVENHNQLTLFNF